MATKLEKMHDKLNKDYRDLVINTMQDKFSIEVENGWSLLDTRLTTTRVDGKNFTKQQKAYMGSFSDGFAAAMNIVSDGL